MAGLLDQLTPYIISGAAAQQSAPAISPGLLDSAQVDPSALAAVAPNPTITPSLWQRLRSGFDQVQSGYDRFNNGVGTAMQSPLFNLGLGMMSAAQPFADPGKAIQGAMGNMVAQREAQQQYEMQQLQMARTMALLRQAAGDQTGQSPAARGVGLLPSQSPPQQGLLPPQSSPQQGLFAAPEGAHTSQPPPLPDWLQPITAQTIGQMPLPGGLTARQAQAYGALAGKDPAETGKAIYAQQLQLAQQRYAPVIGALDTARQSDDPQRLIQADPQLSAAWPQIAAAAGVDPAKATPAQVRTALTVARNHLSSELSQATIAPPVQLQNIQLPDGRTAQVNPVTGQQTILPASPVSQAVGPDGKPVYVPLAKAPGQQPYNAANFVNTGTTQGIAQLIADYKMPPLSGFALRSPQGQAVMAEVQALNPNYDATQYATKNKARESFATGKQGDTVRSLSVATSHLNTLGQLVDALGNHDVGVFNTIGNRWAQETGNPAPTNFDTVKNIVADEVTKAVIGYGGSQADRDKAAAVINRANSPAQLKGAIATYEKLMGGQLEGLRRQYERSTGLHDFDQFLSPDAQTALEPASSGSSTGAPVRITSDTEYNGLKSGTRFLAPDGTVRIKP